MGGVRRVAFGALVLLFVVGVAAWWAGSRGYIPPVWNGGWGCTDVGYPSPVPSFDELVNDYGESPYCARRVLGEEWF